MNIDEVFINFTHAGKIGDTAVVEPALREFGRAHGVRINIHVARHHLDMFRGHPCIVPSAEPFPDRWTVKVDLDAAFFRAHADGTAFGAGFFPQLGLARTESTRVHYRNYYYESLIKKNVDISVFDGATLVVPYSHSCRSRDGSTGRLMPGSSPNAQPPQSWWKEVIAGLPGPVVALVGAESAWNPPFPFCEEARDLSMHQIFTALLLCRSMVSVETGILHLTSATKTPTVFLSSATPVTFARPDTDCVVVRGETALHFSARDVIRAANNFPDRRPSVGSASPSLLGC
jgi:hypothetical protein